MDSAIQSNVDYHERLDRNGDEPEVSPVMRDLARDLGRRLRHEMSTKYNEASASGDKEGEQSTPNYQS